jgi:hypothetical protein
VDLKEERVGHRVLICDRDAKWSIPVRSAWATQESGAPEPFQAPNTNAYAEHFVRSIKHE